MSRQPVPLQAEQSDSPPGSSGTLALDNRIHIQQNASPTPQLASVWPPVPLQAKQSAVVPTPLKCDVSRAPAHVQGIPSPASWYLHIYSRSFPNTWCGRVRISCWCHFALVCVADPQHRVRRGVVGSKLPPSEPRRPHSEGWYMQVQRSNALRC